MLVQSQRNFQGKTCELNGKRLIWIQFKSKYVSSALSPEARLLKNPIVRSNSISNISSYLTNSLML